MGRYKKKGTNRTTQTNKKPQNKFLMFWCLCGVLFYFIFIYAIELSMSKFNCNWTSSVIDKFIEYGPICFPFSGSIGVIVGLLKSSKYKRPDGVSFLTHCKQLFEQGISNFKKNTIAIIIITILLII